MDLWPEIQDIVEHSPPVDHLDDEAWGDYEPPEQAYEFLTPDDAGPFLSAYCDISTPPLESITVRCSPLPLSTDLNHLRHVDSPLGR
jgi:hypothetical protein